MLITLPLGHIIVLSPPVHGLQAFLKSTGVHNIRYFLVLSANDESMSPRSIRKRIGPAWPAKYLYISSRPWDQWRSPVEHLTRRERCLKALRLLRLFGYLIKIFKSFVFYCYNWWLTQISTEKLGEMFLGRLFLQIRYYRCIMYHGFLYNRTENSFEFLNFGNFCVKFD